MKQHSDDKLIGEILQKATKIQAPDNLSSKIFERWQLEEERIPASIPVIPKAIWYVFTIFLAALFIWGFSQLTFSPDDSPLVPLSAQALEIVELSIVGLEEIVFPSVVVLLLIFAINFVLLRVRRLQQTVLGA